MRKQMKAVMVWKIQVSNQKKIGFMFQDSFATARKSEINQRVYIRHTFRIEDILNGNNIIVLFRIYNICQQKQIIKSLYLESKDGKKIFADNSFPTLILPEKYSDFIFFATSENNLLQEVSKVKCSIYSKRIYQAMKYL